MTFGSIIFSGVDSLEMAMLGLDKLGIDSNGLDKTDRTILRTIIEVYDGGPVGLEALAASINDAADSIEVYYEPFLKYL